MMQQTLKGKNFLKVTGIIMIVGAGIGLISTLTTLTSCLAFTAALAGYSAISILLSLSVSGVELAAGIMGVKYCEKQEKAGTCMVLGIVMAALALLNCVYSNVYSGLGGGITVVSVILSLVLPTLYIIGAVMNKNGMTAGPQVFNSAAPRYGAYEEQRQSAYSAAPQHTAPDTAQNSAAQSADWTCSCGGTGNMGKFCVTCGAAKPEAAARTVCARCGWRPEDPSEKAKFCPRCGTPIDNG